ncbi:MAG TPA: YcgL domain-containing protein [Sedimenticola sp.]|nr:YcgL domain-containing protein [Sedimenticola sp.]
MSLPCWIYKSPKKDEMYLYLAREGDFDCVPELLLRRFGEPSLVMELELHEERRLARAEVTEVMRRLREEGYYLQMPPKLVPEIYHGNLD